MMLRLAHEDPAVVKFLEREVRRWIKQWKANNSPDDEGNLLNALTIKQAYKAGDPEPLIEMLEAIRDQRTRGLRGARLRKARAEIRVAKSLLEPLYLLREMKKQEEQSHVA